MPCSPSAVVANASVCKAAVTLSQKGHVEPEAVAVNPLLQLSTSSYLFGRSRIGTRPNGDLNPLTFPLVLSVTWVQWHGQKKTVL